MDNQEGSGGAGRHPITSLWLLDPFEMEQDELDRCLLELAEATRGFMAATNGKCPPRVRELTAVAAAGDVDSASALGCVVLRNPSLWHLSSTGPILRRGWLWYAAHEGSKGAQVMFACEVYRDLRSGRAQALGVVRAARLALVRVADKVMQWAHDPRDIHNALGASLSLGAKAKDGDGEEADWGTDDNTQEAEEEGDKACQASTQPGSLVVAPRLGSCDAQYASLGSPLPLRECALSPGQLHRQLAAEFPWMIPAIDRVRDDLALAALVGVRAFRIRPMLITGPPGVGKSRFVRRLAELAGIHWAIISAGGSSDSRDLQGTAKGWSKSRPARPVVEIASARVANPLLLVDEVDKVSPSRTNGSVWDSLLAMLEPGTAKVFPDEGLGCTCDISWVSWVLCANDADKVPAALRSRLGIVEVGRPRQEDFGIVLSGVLDDVAAEYGISPAHLPELDEAAVSRLRAAFARGGQPRQLRAGVLRALATAASAVTKH